MEFFNFLKSESDSFETRLVAIYAISGIVNFLVIAIIIFSVSSSAENDLRNFLLFAVGVFAFVRTQKYSLEKSTLIVEGVITKIRIRLSDKIRRTELAAFDQIGESRLMNLLTQETMNISGAAKLISRLCSSGTLVFVGLLYIAYLSLNAFVITVVLIIFGIALYRDKKTLHEKEWMEAHLKENEFFETVHHLLDGFKEIKINDAKNSDLFKNHLKPAAEETEALKISSSFKQIKTMIFAQIFSYLLMGSMIFIFPKIVEIQHFDLVQVVTVILFITTGPLQEVVGAFPLVERANVAVRNLQRLEAELEQVPLDQIRDEERPRRRIFKSLECAHVEFEYNHNNAESPFHIGPLDFSLKRGEIVFLMGWNGAGKTTFLKVLTGLYFPSSGHILWNGRKVSRDDLPLFRANFSVVFQDMHLFDRVYGVKQINTSRVDELLDTMQLANKTSISENGRISNIHLSAGQKKRLALIVAELEDRDVYVFDEWAADQDPVFRNFFYEAYLMDLKKRGKTILAVTHDEKYYAIADRIYQMDYGRLSEISVKA